jgi:hypothetical protein
MNQATNHMSIDTNRLAEFAASLHRLKPGDVHINMRPLRGGLRAATMALVVKSAAAGLRTYSRLIVKRATGSNHREAAVYRSLGDHGAAWLAPHLTRELRQRYWLAAACNALSGALRYHIDIAQTARDNPKRRAASLTAARDWLRIIRRADQG